MASSSWYPAGSAVPWGVPPPRGAPPPTTVTVPASVTLVQVPSGEPGGVTLQLGAGADDGVRWRVQSIDMPTLARLGGSVIPRPLDAAARPARGVSHRVYPKEQVHVFCDWSNIASRLRETPPEVLLPHILRQAGVEWPAGGIRRCATSAPSYTRALWLEELLQSYGFTPFVERRPSGSGEQGVDSRLAVDMHALVDSQPADAPQTLVVLGGDGRVHANGGSIHSGVTAAMRKGWRVEVWGVEGSIHKNFMQMQKTSSGRLKVLRLAQPTVSDRAAQWRPRHIPCVQFTFQFPAVQAVLAEGPAPAQTAAGGAGEAVPRADAVEVLCEGEHLYATEVPPGTFPLRELMAALQSAQAKVDTLGGALTNAKWNAACAAPGKHMRSVLKHCRITHFSHLAVCLNGLAVQVTGAGRNRKFAPFWGETRSGRRVPLFIHRWLRQILVNAKEGMRVQQVIDEWLHLHCFSLNDTAVILGYAGDRGTPVEDLLLDYPDVSNGPPTFRWHVPGAPREPIRTAQPGARSEPVCTVQLVAWGEPVRTAQPAAPPAVPLSALDSTDTNTLMGRSGHVFSLHTVCQLLKCMPEEGTILLDDVEERVRSLLQQEVDIGQHTSYTSALLDLPPSCVTATGEGRDAALRRVVIPTLSGKVVPGVVLQWLIQAVGSIAKHKKEHPNITVILAAQLGDHMQRFAPSFTTTLLGYKSLRHLLIDIPTAFACSSSLEYGGPWIYLLLVPVEGDAEASGASIPYPHVLTPTGVPIPLKWLVHAANTLHADPGAASQVRDHIQLMRVGLSPADALDALVSDDAQHGPFVRTHPGTLVPVLAGTRSGKAVPIVAQTWLIDTLLHEGAVSPASAILGAQVGHTWTSPFPVRTIIKALGYKSLTLWLCDMKAVGRVDNIAKMPTFYAIKEEAGGAAAY